MARKKNPLPIGIGEIKNAIRNSEKDRTLSPTPRFLDREEKTVKLLNKSLTTWEEDQEENMTIVEEENFEADENIEEEKDQEEGQLSIDIFQTEENLYIIAPIAGVKKEKIQITLTDDVLSIRGKRTCPAKPLNDQYFTQECFWGPFSRSIVLPPYIDKNNITAKFHEHVLIIRLAKTEYSRTKTIKIDQ